MKVKVYGSTWHWRRPLCAHSPQTWPWWRLFWLRFCRLAVHPPNTGYRVWLYTRWGALFADVAFDRRTADETEAPHV